MSSYFRSHSSQQASIPSSTYEAPLVKVPIPSFINVLSGPTTTWLVTTGAILLTLLVLEQSVYRRKKGILPGDKWTIPLIGKFADSLKPTMEGYKKQWDSGALSAISVFNIFIVMASSNEYARKILNSPVHSEPCLVHSAKQILMPDNWVFLTGKIHVDYRRVLNTLFTRKALSMYLSTQDQISRKHFSEWLAKDASDPTPKDIMLTARNLNMEASLRVFCGTHIPHQATAEISEQYWSITKALELVNFPFAFPGTKVYKAIQARKVAHKWLELAANSSKIAMAKEGAEPECMLDEWNKTLMDPSYKGRKEFSDREMAMVVFSFLFASQDAMSSGLIYGFQHLADHPEILAKIRDEQEVARAGDFEKPMSLELYDQMPYLKAFVKESLRVKPPVLMVPYKTTKPFAITKDYTVPVNSMLIPSFFNSLHDPTVFPKPDALQPERWLDPESTANANPQNYLVFGSGPHKCIGIEYANMSMALMLGNAVSLMQWEHDVTPLSDKVQIIATVFPQDGCRLTFSPRNRA